MKNYKYRRALHDKGIRERRIMIESVFYNDGISYSQVITKQNSMAEQRALESEVRKQPLITCND